MHCYKCLFPNIHLTKYVSYVTSKKSYVEILVFEIMAVFSYNVVPVLDQKDLETILALSFHFDQIFARSS